MITTHSRHVLDTMYADAKILWVQEGAVSATTPEDQVDILLELGALDIKEKVSAGKFKVIMLTEDRFTQYLNIVFRNSGFVEEETVVLPYNGITTVHLLKPLIRQIKEISKAAIFVHRDRDYLEPDEIEAWKKDIRGIGAEPFVTSEIDIEGYFCTSEYLEHVLSGRNLDIKEILSQVEEGERDEIIASYVNGRVDFERKNGTIGKLDIGKLSAAAGRLISKTRRLYEREAKASQTAAGDAREIRTSV